MSEEIEDDYFTTSTMMRSTADRLMSLRRRTAPRPTKGHRRCRRIESVDNVINRLIDYWEENHPSPNSN